jgi:NADPH:quinone reductase-like Zn-dependent oxidoreductase
MSATTTTHPADTGDFAVDSTHLGSNTRQAFMMKAITRERFGAPDVLQFDDVDWPRFGAGEVLVEVHAAGVNQGDVLELHGWPYLGRLMGYGVRRPKRPVPGTDIAGRVVAVGTDVHGVDVDDEVVGWGTGAFAELATMPANMMIGRPPTVPVEHAAAVPTAGATALQAVRDAGRVKPGQHVLVIGASGGVGTFAVQIAKADGAEVTGVSGPSNVGLVRSIGADHVVDYTHDDITTHIGRYDVIVDLVGNRPLRAIRRALTRTGTLVVVGGQNPRTLTGMRRFAAAAAMSPFTRQRLVALFSKPNRDDLAALIQLVAEGAVRPIVGSTFDLTETAAAFHRVETGHASGKVIVTVASPASTMREPT